VEANPDVASATIELLEHLGYHVRHVPDGMSALRDQVEVDVVFSDIVMPGPLDGLVLLHTLKEKITDAPGSSRNGIQ
jgi:CheY-like chemotaxis protein